MRQARWWLSGIGFFAVGVVLLGYSSAQAQKEPTAAKAFKPVTSVHDMMEGQELIFDRMRKAISGKKWHEAEAQAWVLAELGNVNARQKDDARYSGFAESMSGHCVELARALKKKDEEAAKSAASRVNTSCKTCHDEYRKEKADQ